MKKIICKSCGTKNKGKSLFCTKCGANLSEQTIAPVLTGETAADINHTAEGGNDFIMEQSEILAPKKRKKKLPIIIACCVLVSGGGGFAAYKLLPIFNSDEQTVTVNMFNDGLVPYRDGDKFVYLNKKGNTAINPQFDYVSDFHDGIARVGIGEEDDLKYGYIDTNGEYVIDAQYDTAHDFTDGMAIVVSGDYAGVIDSNGDYLINPQYDPDDIFYVGNKISETQFAEIPSPSTLPDLNNDSCDTDLIPFETVSGKYCYVDKSGKTVIEANFDYAV